MRACSIRVSALVSLLVAGCHVGGAAHPEQVHWTYRGEAGPARWGDLAPAFATCKSGTHQAPIDLANARADLGPGALDIRSAPASARLQNNGHTVQLLAGPGNVLIVGGKRYPLRQIHFHAPSEHTVDGKAAAMEVHMVHEADDHTVAVVAVLLAEGKDNPWLASFWDHLPAAPGEPVDTHVTVDPRGVLTDASAYFSYEGSLTTPPCTEGLRWFVLVAQGTVSPSQVARFEALLGDNARPVQPLGDRMLHRTNP